MKIYDNFRLKYWLDNRRSYVYCVELTMILQSCVYPEETIKAFRAIASSKEIGFLVHEWCRYLSLFTVHLLDP